MGCVLDANSKAVAHHDETVETPATQSCNLSVGSPWKAHCEYYGTCPGAFLTNGPPKVKTHHVHAASFWENARKL